MGGSSKNKECTLIKCKTKEQQKKKIVAPCTCTLPTVTYLSRVLDVVSFFGFFSLQWSILHLFQTKKEEYPK
jgi:hypothetical protein